MDQIEKVDRSLTYTVFFSNNENSFVAECEEIPTVVGYGPTRLEALRELQSEVRRELEILYESHKKSNSVC